MLVVFNVIGTIASMTSLNFLVSKNWIGISFKNRNVLVKTNLVKEYRSLIRVNYSRYYNSLINLFLQSNFSKSFLILFLILNSFLSFSQEICNNGIDDDNDLLIDLNDTECFCNNQTTGNPTSIIPNPSFEDTNCCPLSFGFMSCVDTWVQASDATSDYYNSCSYAGPFGPLGSLPLLPFPDGNGAVGEIIFEGYNESMGTCLLNPLLAGTQYSLQLQIACTGTTPAGGHICSPNINSQTLDLFIYGNPNCGNLPLTGYDCPLNLDPNYIALASTPINVQTTNYQTVIFTFTPSININEIIIGGPCTLPPGWLDTNSVDPINPCYPLLVIDNLVLTSKPISISDQGLICNNDLVLTCSTSIPGGNFQWYQNGIAINGQTSNTLNVSNLSLGQGNYQVTYGIDSSCYKDEITVIATLVNPLTVNNATICESEIAELIVSGGTTYTWTPSLGLSSNSGSIVSSSPNQTTTYTITSIDTNGCIINASSTVNVIATTNTLSVNNAEICEGEIAELNVSGGTTYTWTPSTGLSSNTGSNITASPNQTTVYTVSSIISNGCVSETTSTVTVYNIINDINFNIIQIPLESEVILTACPANYSYTWTTPEGLISNTNPLNYQFSKEEGILQFLIETENEFGCLYSETIEIKISTDLIVYIPNTFTPDGNEFNNTFKPIVSNNVDSEAYTFLIFNRWGELIFESKDPNIGWDGTYLGLIVQSGVYTWIVKLKNQTDIKEINGHVNLLR